MQDCGHHIRRRWPGALAASSTRHPACRLSLQAVCQCFACSQLVACMWVLACQLPAALPPWRTQVGACSLPACWWHALQFYVPHRSFAWLHSQQWPVRAVHLTSSWSSALVTVACCTAARTAPVCVGHLPVPSNKRTPSYCCRPSPLPLQPPSLHMRGHWGPSWMGYSTCWQRLQSVPSCRCRCWRSSAAFLSAGCNFQIASLA